MNAARQLALTLVVATLHTTTVAPARAEPLNQLIARHGTLSGGGLTFSGFAVNPVPFSHPQGALVNDGADLDVTVITTNGFTGLRFTGIDPGTGAISPIVADSFSGPRNLLRNATYTVSTLDPRERIHAVHQSMGPGTFSVNDLTVAYLGYFLSPGGGAGLLMERIFTQFGGTASNDAILPVPYADVRSLGFGDELELASSHGGKHVASAVVDWFDVTFETRTICSADFNDDGFVTGEDFDAFSLDFVAGVTSADFDGDGFVTGEDFDSYVAAFEAGC